MCEAGRTGVRLRVAVRYVHPHSIGVKSVKSVKWLLPSGAFRFHTSGIRGVKCVKWISASPSITSALPVGGTRSVVSLPSADDAPRVQARVEIGSGVTPNGPVPLTAGTLEEFV